IIEASGIADPAGIATVVASGGLRLDGVVSVVDAAAMDTWIGNPATADLFQRQLDAAHLIVLNKADLIDDTGQRAAMDRLGTMAPGRPVILTEQGRLDPEVALGAALRGARSDPGVAAHEANRFATKTIPLDGPIDRHAFAIFLGNPPAGLLRMKGFVETIEAPGQLWLVQSVGRLWSIEPVKSAPGAISPLPGLVMIGIAGTEQAWQPFAKV
ncbi:MAG: hypothetical protein HN732_05850, partial [Rhodospirillaceae bacterium]|nr:hypothetical protein [Rhodospirillaceae bacterium]